VCDDFGVRLARELVVEKEVRLELLVVVDDPVVNDGDPIRAVGMRMRVALRGCPVGTPSRVADAEFAFDTEGTVRLSISPLRLCTRNESSRSAIPAES